MVANPLPLSFSNIYFWRGEGSCKGQLCSCLDNVKVCDSWGTFCLQWWMRKHHAHPKLILKYNDNSFSMTGLVICNFLTPLMSFVEPPLNLITWQNYIRGHLCAYIYIRYPELSSSVTRAGLIHCGGGGRWKKQTVCHFAQVNLWLFDYMQFISEYDDVNIISTDALNVFKWDFVTQIN